MRIWHGLDEVGAELGPSVVTIGNFDGVHRGHRAVLARAREKADELGLPVVAMTFDPHPMKVLRPDRAPAMLTTTEQRAELLAGAGADAVLVLPFDREVAAWSPEEFIERALVGVLQAKAVVVGENFRFGHRAAGTVETLAAARRFEVIGVGLTGGERPWSSTYVRERIAEGDVEGAAEALGRPHRVSGIVVEGDHRGRELGVPTANLPADPGSAIPADGVYAGWLTVVRPAPGGPAYPGRMPAAISVGTNPTFDGVERRVESHVIDRDDLELYGVLVTVDFVLRLRGQVKFESIDELIAQMKADVDATRAALVR